MIEQSKVEGVVRKIFNGVESGELTRAQALDKISLKKLHTFSTQMQALGYVVISRDEDSKGHPISTLRLTDKGRELLSIPAPTPSMPTPPENTLPAVAHTPYTDILEESTRITDEFNKLSPSWEWRLHRKEALK